jgi:antitoxin (DNA-binding transcriptional repressor) of toxin-antitoxin stability system
MQTINIHEAKTHLSRLVEDAALGKIFIIAKAGKPMVKVTPLAVDENEKISKLGFMSGEISVPDDFDLIGSGHLSDLFEGRAHEVTS